MDLLTIYTIQLRLLRVEDYLIPFPTGALPDIDFLDMEVVVDDPGRSGWAKW